MAGQGGDWDMNNALQWEGTVSGLTVVACVTLRELKKQGHHGLNGCLYTHWRKFSCTERQVKPIVAVSCLK